MESETRKTVKTKNIIIIIVAGLLLCVIGFFSYRHFFKNNEINTPEIVEVDRIAELELYLAENYDKYIIDGSTSLIPLHEALEAKFGTGKEVKHSKTVAAFEDFVEGKIDILLAVDYLDSYFEKANEKNVEINKKEITKEALVFLKNNDFKIENLKNYDIIKTKWDRNETKWDV